MAFKSYTCKKCGGTFENPVHTRYCKGILPIVTPTPDVPIRIEPNSAVEAGIKRALELGLAKTIKELL